jgi:hypothetical protein
MDSEVGPDYDFDTWLARRSDDWNEDDALLHELQDRHAPGADLGRLAADRSPS